MGSLYSEVPTWLHRRSAGGKLLALVLLGLALVLTQNLVWIAALGALCAAVLLSLGTALRPVRALLWMVGITAAVLTAFHTWMGNWELGAVTSIRLGCASGMGAALTVSTRSGDLIEVLERMLSPLRRFGVSPEHLSLQLGLMLRFTEHFFVQWNKLNDSYRLRGGRGAAGLGNWRLLAALAVQMLQTARRVADALFIRLGS